jgi:hypothetical protein
MKLIDVYVQEERYNSRIKATVPPWWVAVYDNGAEMAICPDYKAKNAEEAKSILISMLVGA